MHIKNSLFIKSLDCFRKKNLPQYLFTVVYDLIYYFIFIFSLAIFIKYILPEATFLFQTNSFVEGMQNLPLEALMVMGQQIKSSLYVFGIFTALIFILLLANFSFFKGLIWAKIFNKKLDFKKVLYLSILNFCLMLLFILFFAITANYVVAKIQAWFFVLVILPAIIYITHSANALFVLDKLKSFFKVTFKKIYLFILPYMIMTTFTLVVLFLLSQIAIYMNFIPFNVRMFINLLVFIIYFSWAKRYLGLVFNTAL